MRTPATAKQAMQCAADNKLVPVSCALESTNTDTQKVVPRIQADTTQFALIERAHTAYFDWLRAAAALRDGLLNNCVRLRWPTVNIQLRTGQCFLLLPRQINCYHHRALLMGQAAIMSSVCPSVHCGKKVEHRTAQPREKYAAA